MVPHYTSPSRATTKNLVQVSETNDAIHFWELPVLQFGVLSRINQIHWISLESRKADVGEFTISGRNRSTSDTRSMEVRGNFRPIRDADSAREVAGSLHAWWLEFDWNDRREERQRWACWHDSVRFRVLQDWAASRTSFFISVE